MREDVNARHHSARVSDARAVVSLPACRTVDAVRTVPDMHMKRVDVIISIVVARCPVRCRRSTISIIDAAIGPIEVAREAGQPVGRR